MNPAINPEIFTFLKELQTNNNREWFDAQKPRYQTLYDEFKHFHAALMEKMKAHDQIEKGRVYRIYRDVRFSKDKTPYKGYLAFNFKRATHFLRGGYYFQLEPGNSFLAGGFFGPNAKDLLHIRNQISQYPDPMFEILNSDVFKNYFGELRGERLKTAPKGFEKDDEAIEVLRHKQFYVEHAFSDEEVLSAGFMDQLNEGFQNLRPFFDYMSEILTTDLNGEELM
ncbi:DUF2461 domain-containing protein [Marinoscillum pacificum]|uniref:DUF2461 domain-containing protein n=1 Tax=Marinoscillum pacificum TaxID=392723 RepID=UPI002157AD0A|nr:DUF2461 domain-containing protein [Marinoscillum pacificum]